MQPFQRLAAGRAAHDLTLAVYRASASWPKHELYGLAGQARRAAVSVCANLSEGATGKGPKEYRRFIDIARGSHGELQYLIMLATDLGYLEAASADALHGRLSKAGCCCGICVRQRDGPWQPNSRPPVFPFLPVYSRPLPPIPALSTTATAPAVRSVCVSVT